MINRRYYKLIRYVFITAIFIATFFALSACSLLGTDNESDSNKVTSVAQGDTITLFLGQIYSTNEIGIYENTSIIYDRSIVDFYGVDKVKPLKTGSTYVSIHVGNEKIIKDIVVYNGVSSVDEVILINNNNDEKLSAFIYEAGTVEAKYSNHQNITTLTLGNTYTFLLENGTTTASYESCLFEIESYNLNWDLLEDKNAFVRIENGLIIPIGYGYGRVIIKSATNKQDKGVCFEFKTEFRSASMKSIISDNVLSSDSYLTSQALIDVEKIKVKSFAQFKPDDYTGYDYYLPNLIAIQFDLTDSPSIIGGFRIPSGTISNIEIVGNPEILYYGNIIAESKEELTLTLIDFKLYGYYSNAVSVQEAASALSLSCNFTGNSSDAGHILSDFTIDLSQVKQTNLIINGYCGIYGAYFPSATANKSGKTAFRAANIYINNYSDTAFNIYGGRGTDGNTVSSTRHGGDGGNGIVCEALCLEGKFIIAGGNGGKGSKGPDGQQGTTGQRGNDESEGGSYNGKPGGRGTDGKAGGNGGKGGNAIVADSYIKDAGAVVSATGGVGGCGGDGGKGGKGGTGGRGGDDDHWSFLGIGDMDGGDGGDGGRGGDGGIKGVGGAGGYGLLINSSGTNQSSNGADGAVGDGGDGGTGGRKGDGGDAGTNSKAGNTGPKGDAGKSTAL